MSTSCRGPSLNSGQSVGSKQNFVKRDGFEKVQTSFWYFLSFFCCCTEIYLNGFFSFSEEHKSTVWCLGKSAGRDTERERGGRGVCGTKSGWSAVQGRSAHEGRAEARRACAQRRRLRRLKACWVTVLTKKTTRGLPWNFYSCQMNCHFFKKPCVLND